MLTIAYGLAAALTWAVAALTITAVSRRFGPFAAIAPKNAISALILLPVLVATAGRAPWSATTVAEAVASGLFGAVAQAFGGRAFQTGDLAKVTPIISAEGGVAAVLAIALGENVGGVELAAILLMVGGAVLAAWRVAATPGSRRTGGALAALGAALAFGLMLILLSRAASGAGIWPALALSRLATTVVALPLLWKAPLRPFSARLGGMLVLNAAADTAGYALFAAAAVSGIAIGAVLASLWPIATVALGVVLFHERPTARQWAGVLVAGAGVALLGLAA